MGLRAAWQRLRGRGGTAQWDPARTDLVVVASSFDDAEACSAALARAADWRPEESALLRHHLRIPPARVDEVTALAAQDGYRRAVEHTAGTEPERASAGDAGPDSPQQDDVALILQRVQVLDALHCSQERSRMAGLAQRHDGVALGWDALQPQG
ncbi:hypothetical protein [Nocardia blacklockiae]|uniref:hypothetical protein n=1 Tax=Nocardia blacklockiae TaxID=480036 RepID=UPI00189560DF|nr:hypothetical protein [Nocardia blacklockiae]MBF6174087.1 hypothetical protein [Nocardia blacklockiae]